MRKNTPHQSPGTQTGISSQGTAFSITCPSSPVPRSRPALVFIHGVGLNKAVWQVQTEAFSDRYTTICYDMLGHGDSPLPVLKPTLSDYAAQLEQLLAYLNIEQAHIIGHSMGALIGIEFALSYAHRVSSVIALNIVYQRDQAQRKAVLNRAESVLSSGEISGIEQALNRWFEGQSGERNRQKVNQIRQWMEQTNSTGYGRSYQLFASSDNVFSGRLNQLTMPVLYLTGSRDLNSTPEMSQKMAADTPRGRARVIDQEAHMMAYILPDTINAVIRQFIDNISPEALA